MVVPDSAQARQPAFSQEQRWVAEAWKVASAPNGCSELGMLLGPHDSASCLQLNAEGERERRIGLPLPGAPA